MHQRPLVDLSGLTAVVTGASSGIGRAIAVELGRCGAAVLVHARRSREAAEETADQVRLLKQRAEVALADLGDPAEHDAFVERAWQWREGVDIWVNNAGADVLTGPNAKLPFADKLELLWRIDVLATIRLSRMVGRLMRQRGHGVILNMGWDQAEQGMAGDSGEMFAATKGAIMAFSRSLAHSLAPQVRVNCLAPGWIKTSWGEQASDYWQQRAQAESLLERWGSPADVAHVACFLASSAAQFLTCQTVPINGGLR